MKRASRLTPDWLRPHWEKKKQETAGRISAAIAQLSRAGQPVTFSSIRETVQALYGLPLSTNTIRRNELAYEIYQQHRQPPKTRIGRSPSLIALYKESDPEHRPSLYAKVARLRRESKDTLIARVIRTEARISQQAHIENELREDVIELGQKLLAIESGAGIAPTARAGSPHARNRNLGDPN